MSQSPHTRSPQSSPLASPEQALDAVIAGKLERARSRAGEDYLQVPTALFVGRIDVKMAPLPQVAFYDRGENGEFECIRMADQPYSALALSRHEHIWIRAAEFAPIERYAQDKVLSARPSGADVKGGLPPERRMEVLRHSAIKVVEDLFEHPTPENITRSTKVVSSFVHLLMKDPKSYLFLARLSSHDPYTLQHSVGTAVNAIILARKVGITSEDELQEVGLGGLLHDIGKVRVRREIINKEGPLDEREWDEMRTHSSAGYDIVKDHPSISDRTKRAILEHHEDKVGTGYPSGKKGAEIDLFSKIVCVADIFNALTTNRSYSEARTPFDALALMRDKLGHKVDPDLFKQMVMIYGGKIDDLAA